MTGLPVLLRVTWYSLSCVLGSPRVRATAQPVPFVSISLAGVGVNPPETVLWANLKDVAAGHVLPPPGFEIAWISDPTKLPLELNRFVPMIAKNLLSPSFG